MIFQPKMKRNFTFQNKNEQQIEQEKREKEK